MVKLQPKILYASGFASAVIGSLFSFIFVVAEVQIQAYKPKAQVMEEQLNLMPARLEMIKEACGVLGISLIY